MSITQDINAVNIEKIPDSMKQEPRWCVWKWKYITDPKTKEPVYNKDGTRKKTKVPHHGETATEIDATNPDNGTTFETALKTLNRFSARGGVTNVAGIGFLLGDGWAGVDLDKVLDPVTRKVTAAWADDVINTLDTYSEISPSGRGVKMILRATEDDLLGRDGYEDIIDLHHKMSMPDGTALEIYVDDRFFTLTGDHLDGTPCRVQDHAEQLAEVYYHHFASKIEEDRRSWSRRNTAKGDFKSPEGLTIDAQGILDVAGRASNGKKILTLWEGGSVHGSESEDDAALVSMLAFYAGPDPDLIERLMYESRRCRAKWDSKRRGHGTWLQMTIAKYMHCAEYFNWTLHQTNERCSQEEERLEEIFAGADPTGDAPSPSPSPGPTTRKDYDPSDYVRDYQPAKVAKFRFQRWDELCAVADNQTEDWYIPHWLEFGTLGLFTGLPFSGKSTIVGEIIAATVQKRDFYGMAVQSCPIILLDLENKERILVKRIRSCLDGNPGDIQALLYRVPPKEIALPLTTDWVRQCIRQLRETIGEIGTKHGVLFIDTFRSAFAGSDGFDEIDPGAMVKLLKPLKDLAEETGWAIMVLHHNAKHSNAYSGTTAIAGVADYLWNWQVDKKTLKGILSVEGRDDYREPLAFKYNPETRRNDLIGTVSEQKTDEKTSKEDEATYHLLRFFPQEDEGITVPEAANRAVLHEKYVQKKIGVLYNEGLITRTGTGRRNSPFLYSATIKGADFIMIMGLKLNQK